MSGLKTAEAAGKTTAIRSTVTGGQAIEALAAEVLWKAPAGHGLEGDTNNEHGSPQPYATYRSWSSTGRSKSRRRTQAHGREEASPSPAKTPAPPG
jgi:hypothetical protein